MNELKPCPFCGGTVVSIEKMTPRLYRQGKKFSVVCWECDLLFGYNENYGGMFDTKAEAIEAWNRRANMNEQEKIILNLADTLEGEINRMCVTKELSEFDTMYGHATRNLDKLSKIIYDSRFKEGEG